MDKDTSDAIAHAAAILFTPVLAFIAAGLKYARQIRQGINKWSWGEFFLQSATAVLAGYIAEWLFTAWKSDPHLIHAAVALAGWGGAQAVEFFGKKVGTDEASS